LRVFYKNHDEITMISKLKCSPHFASETASCGYASRFNFRFLFDITHSNWARTHDAKKTGGNKQFRWV